MATLVPSRSARRIGLLVGGGKSGALTDADFRVSTVSPSQSERLPSSVFDLTGAAACGEGLSPPGRHSILQANTTSRRQHFGAS